MDDPAAQRIWHAALGQLQIHVTRPNYETWLKDTVGLRLEDGLFVVGAPTEFIKEWLTTRMRGLVTQTLGGILGRPVEVGFEIIGRNGNGHPNGHELPLAGASLPQLVASSPSPRQRLNPKYTFDTFVVGDSNRLAAAAAIAAAERPGDDYNPLFIYSAPGLGKTHLLHAIAQRAAGHHKLAYVTSEQFTNEFVTAVAHSKTDEFRRRYRFLQLLLLDDVQFLAGKERTQEEFFYTFNDLHSNGCQVVVACDRPPTSVAGFEVRLRSRLQWGLIADIQPPDNEMRLAILRSKASQLHVSLPPDVAQLLANRVRENIRELEGSLNRIIAYARLTSAPSITADLAGRALSALKPRDPSPTSPQAILNAVTAYFSIPQGALASKTRARPIAEARHLAMYLLREDAQLALKEIGHLLGSRDHSTVIHGLRRVSSSLSGDPRVAAQVGELRRLLST